MPQILVTLTAPTGFVTWRYAIYATKPLSAGIAKPKDSLYRFMQMQNKSPFGTGTLVFLNNAYFAKYGQLVSGCKVFIKVKLIDQFGLAGPTVYTWCVIT